MGSESPIYSARRAREANVRPLLDVVTHAVCRIELPTEISLEQAPEALAERVVQEGFITEHNGTFNEEIAPSVEHVNDKYGVAEVLPGDFHKLLKDFFSNGCTLHRKRYDIVDESERRHCFEVSLSGDIRQDMVSGVWAGFDDVTDKIELENNLITSLEQHQSKLARELHDSIGQLLTSVRILSENLVDKLAPELEDERELARRVRNFASDATDEISRLENGLLTPEELSEEGLLEALQYVAETTDSLPNIRCVFSGTTQVHLHDATTRLHLYRIAQEAVNNAVRHAEPDRIDISLGESSGRVRLEISDDGSGFDVPNTVSEGLGLESIKYRADLIGAELDIESAAGRGTTVSCTLSNPSNDT